MRKIWSLPIIGVLSLCAVFAYGLHKSEIAALEAKTKALDEFCRLTRHSQRYDIAALTSEKSTTRARALTMIQQDIIHHGPSSVIMCLGAKTPNLSGWCRGTDDETCFARQARLFHDALQKAGW